MILGNTNELLLMVLILILVFRREEVVPIHRPHNVHILGRIFSIYCIHKLHPRIHNVHRVYLHLQRGVVVSEVLIPNLH